jgi:signal peptidase I
VRPAARLAVHRLGQLVAVLCGLLVAALVSGALSVVSVSSTSMVPTVCAGDRLLLLTPRAASRARRGDLVTFREPGPGAQSLLKRVVAVAGQTVELVDGRLLVDGQPQDEAYVDAESVDGTFFGPVEVRPERVFVLGDDREHAVDSRDFGDVPRAALTGTVVGRLTGSCRR